MNRRISQFTLVVNDYDEAIAFYTQKLDFKLVEDTILNDQKRWVVISPKNPNDCCVLLAKAVNENQNKAIGNQTGGRVFLFLETDNFEKEYENLIHNNIKIVREPSIENYGKVAVFEDLYGNLWDLIEPVKKTPFCTTGILMIKEESLINLALKELSKLQKYSREEIGNLIFEVQQSIENPREIVVWEQFVDETAFQNHLKSKHLQNFLALNLVDFVKGFPTKLI
ncbi:MAG: VOC family protein [Flavobacterium sp.]|uniref:VOC family protein n=1 Tax=Flavobacterium sp. TaxID=239 RepID=UPI0022C4B099|nr:VOC family protein [Flavobacterium sp.]MCZ8198136.1 VOC family protein [Flavobacterium sp.]